MKIFEIVYTLYPGGAERLVVDLSNQMAEMGHDVTIVTTGDIKKEPHGFYLGDVSEKVKLINLALDNVSKIKSFRIISNLIKEHKPDVVNIHLIDHMMFWPIIRHHKKTAFVNTIHNDIDKYFFAKKPFSRIFLRRNIARILGGLGWTKYVAISQTNFEDMGKRFPKTKSHLIYNGRKHPVPSKDFEKAKKEIAVIRVSPDSIIFVHIGRCTNQKNQELLIKSFNRLVSEGVDAELLVFGHGFDDTEMGRSFKSVADKRIHFLGTRTNVCDYLLLSDVFILSSVFEGMPISLIEALSCGLPCVSTPVCGVVDIVKTGHNGIISSSYDEEDYMTALRQYIDKREHLKAFADKDAKLGLYDIKRTAEEYIKYFNDK